MSNPEYMKLSLEGTKLDRRSKLTNEDKDDIKNLYESGESIHTITKIYNVSRRTIQFVLFPERLEWSKELRKKRGGSKIYYDREKHALAMRKHRQYKKEMFAKGIQDGSSCY